LPNERFSTAFLLPELQSQSTRHRASRGAHRRASAVRHCAASCHGPSPFKRGLKCRTTESTYNSGGGAGAAVPISFRHQGPRRPDPRRPAPGNPGTVVTALPTPLAASLYAGLWATRGSKRRKFWGDEVQPLTRQRGRALGFQKIERHHGYPRLYWHLPHCAFRSRRHPQRLRYPRLNHVKM